MKKSKQGLLACTPLALGSVLEVLILLPSQGVQRGCKGCSKDFAESPGQAAGAGPTCLLHPLTVGLGLAGTYTGEWGRGEGKGKGKRGRGKGKGKGKWKGQSRGKAAHGARAGRASAPLPPLPRPAGPPGSSRGRPRRRTQPRPRGGGGPGPGSSHRRGCRQICSPFPGERDEPVRTRVNAQP